MFRSLAAKEKIFYLQCLIAYSFCGDLALQPSRSKIRACLSSRKPGGLVNVQVRLDLLDAYPLSRPIGINFG